MDLFYLNVNLFDFYCIIRIGNSRHYAVLLWFTSGGVGWLGRKKIKEIDLNF